MAHKRRSHFRPPRPGWGRISYRSWCKGEMRPSFRRTVKDLSMFSLGGSARREGEIEKNVMRYYALLRERGQNRNDEEKEGARDGPKEGGIMTATWIDLNSAASPSIKCHFLFKDSAASADVCVSFDCALAPLRIRQRARAPHFRSSAGSFPPDLFPPPFLPPLARVMSIETGQRGKRDGPTLSQSE